MGRYNREDILALQFRNGTVSCLECATQDEWEKMTEDEIIVDDDEEMVFCDRCKGRLFKP